MIEIRWQPSRKELNVFALLLPVFGAVCAGLLYRRTGSIALAGTIVGTATIVATAGFVFPGFLRRVYVAWMIAVYPIGWIVSHVVMGAVFFLVVTPVGWLVRRTVGDPLQRRFERDRKSYWEPRTPPSSTENYFRQF